MYYNFLSNPLLYNVIFKKCSLVLLPIYYIINLDVLLVFHKEGYFEKEKYL